MISRPQLTVIRPFPLTVATPTASIHPAHINQMSCDGTGTSAGTAVRKPVAAVSLGAGAVSITRQYPFTAERKMMSTLVALDPRNPTTGPVRLYVTGTISFCP